MEENENENCYNNAHNKHRYDGILEICKPTTHPIIISLHKQTNHGNFYHFLMRKMNFIALFKLWSPDCSCSAQITIGLEEKERDKLAITLVSTQL